MRSMAGGGQLPFDPLPNPPPFRGRETIEYAAHRAATFSKALER